MSLTRMAKYSKARAEGMTPREALEISLETIQAPEPKATAKRGSKPKAIKVQRGRVKVTVSGDFVYCFFRHNSHILRVWLEHGFITVQDGVINWSYDDTACYSWPKAGTYPDRLWQTPEERFASVLGCEPLEVPYFWLTHRQEAAAVSW